MKRCFPAILGAMVLAGVAASASAAKSPKIYLAVIDFECGQGKYGALLADSVRLRIRRHKEFEVIDKLTTAETTSPLAAATDKKKITELMTTKLGVNMCVYGSVTKQGQSITAEISLLDLRNPKKPVSWKKTFSDNSERARGVIAMAIIEAVRGKAEWKPPEYGDEDEPKKFPKPLNASGDFESKGGWEPPDGAATFIEAGPSGRGKVLRVRTDLERAPYIEYRRKLRFGLTDTSNPPKIGRDTSYGSMAGLEGIYYRSKWLQATPGQRYWLIADMKGKTAGIFFPKIFVKGFADWSDQADALPEESLVKLKITARDFSNLPAARRKAMIAEDARKHPERYRREVWRWYLACNNEENTWRHYAAPFPPAGGLPKNVQFLRIDIYTYWPPGTYYFDNVQLYKDPRQTAPLPEAQPRTPDYSKPGAVRTTAPAPKPKPKRK